MTVNGTRCCARCKSPYGHVPAAGQCCHPSDEAAAQREMLEVQARADAEITRAAKR